MSKKKETKFSEAIKIPISPNFNTKGFNFNRLKRLQRNKKNFLAMEDSIGKLFFTINKNEKI